MAYSPSTSFGALLRTTRESQGLNQTELAQKAGLTPAGVSQLESGDRLPAFNTIVRLAQALGTSVGFLVGEEAAELPPNLRGLFRQLQGFQADDLKKVEDFARFLKAQTKQGHG